MTSALNPTLFQTLQHRFEDVRISRQGQRREVTYSPDPSHPGRLRSRVLERGEHYNVDCPFCKDDRGRLSISCAYGEPDRAFRGGNYWLWHCFNDQCHKIKNHQHTLRNMLKPPLGREALPSQQEPAEPTPPPRIQLPNRLIPVNALPTTHPAAIYLTDRGFDLNDLATTWGISFCEDGSNIRPCPTNRIFIPAWQPVGMYRREGEDLELSLDGWQARVVPGIEPACVPNAKYFSAVGMFKSQMLYGLLWARGGSGPVYLVEGATDCWRIGPGAVAILGKSLSSTQELLLVHHFPGRPIVVLLDPDARDEAVAIRDKLRPQRSLLPGDNRVVVAELPPMKDPGDCTYEEIQTAADRALGNTTAATIPSEG